MDAPERDWPFAWPPKAREPQLLWLPALPDTALTSIEDALPGTVQSRVRKAEDALMLPSKVRRATLASAGEKHGGSVISVTLGRRRWWPERPAFDSIRYPFVVSLGALFVFWLGFGRAHLVPVGVYQGCVFVLSLMAGVLWTMWGVEHLRESKRQLALKQHCDSIDALGQALYELGARPLPTTDSPFRR